jgi:hypothetical protein
MDVGSDNIAHLSCEGQPGKQLPVFVSSNGTRATYWLDGTNPSSPASQQCKEAATIESISHTKVSRREYGEGTNVGDVELATSIGTTTSWRTSWAHAIATATSVASTSRGHVAAVTTARAAAGCGESRFRFTVLIIETHHVRCLCGLDREEWEEKKK